MTVRTAARSALTWALRAPLTVGLVTVLWVVGAATGSLAHGPSPQLLDTVAVGPDALLAGRWWTPLTSALWCSDLIGYLATTVLLLTLVAPAEQRLGGARTAALLLATQLVGTVIGSLVLLLAARAGDHWAAGLAADRAVGVSPGAVGVGLVFTAALTALWRRRLRLLILLTLILLVAYSGTLLDVLRLTAALTGLIIAMLAPGAPRRPASWRSSRTERRVLVALIVAGTAAGPIIAALSDTAIGPLSVLRFLLISPPPDPATVQQVCLDPSAVDDCRALRAQARVSGVGPAMLTLMPVILTLAAATGLRRGRRGAWWTALVVNLALAGLAVLLATELFGTPREQLAVFGGLRGTQSLLAILLPLTVPLFTAGLLLLTRQTFDVAAPPGTYRTFLLVTGGSLLLLSVGYVAGGYLLREQFDQPPTLLDLLLHLPTRFVPPGYLGEVAPTFQPVGAAATALHEWTGTAFLAVLTAALLWSFRRSRSTPDQAERARARVVLTTHGGSSLAWMTLWPANSYHFTADGRAYLAYRVAGTVAVTVAGPVGPADAHRAAVLQFARFCGDRGWTPCLYSVTGDIRDIAATDLQFHCLQVAQETVLPLTTLSLTGRKWQDVRTAINKANRAGITAQQLHWAHADHALTRQVTAICEEWIADKGLPEMGFTLGGLDELNDEQVRCLIAVDAGHTVHGITSYLPVHRDGRIVGWTLDFMRRRGDSPPGVMEFLIATAALRFRDEGAEFLSLSGAPLARLGTDQPQDPMQRILDTLGRVLEPVYGFRSLLSFKAKFQPDYHPLWMCYPETAALPGIATAITRCYLPTLSARQATGLVRQLRPGRDVRTVRPGRRPSTDHEQHSKRKSAAAPGG